MLKKIIFNLSQIDSVKKLDLLIKLSFFVSSIMLISAFYLEHFQGALPCDLCITQRWFHVLIITYSLILIFIVKKNLISKKLILLGLSIVWIMSSIAGTYHFGIEMKFWKGPEECSSNIDFSKDLLTYLLNKSTIKCDEVMFSVFGLSLAAWNVILSFGMFLFINIIIIKRKF
jgi:disulfide bond formation protein DsbB